MTALDEIKPYVLEQLRRDAEAHEQGHYKAIGTGYEGLSAFDAYADGADDD